MTERKERRRISNAAAATLLYDFDRTCCVCGEPGPVTIHHIDEDPSNNELENLAVLCLPHHNEAHTSGGFARQLGADAIRKYRDEWIARVRRRREAADERVVALIVPEMGPNGSKKGLQPAALKAYVNHLPTALGEVYSAEQTNFDTGVTVEMMQATIRIADVLERMWLLLVEDYPSHRFGGSHDQHISSFRADRAEFHYSLARPTEEDAGSLSRVTVGMGIVADLERIIEQTVSARFQHEEFDLLDWIGRWRRAGSLGDARFG